MRFVKGTRWRSKARYWFGKLIEAWLFVSALLAAVVTPPLFICSMLYNQIYVRLIPPRYELGVLRGGHLRRLI